MLFWQEKILWVFTLKSYLMQVSKPCHYPLVEAVEPFKLHPMSMSYIYEVFEHLLRLWMGIWHIYIVTNTDTFPNLWQLAEILPDASVQTMPLRFGWGCRTFQTTSCIHTYIRCLSTFSGCGWVYGFTLTQLLPQMLPQIWRSLLKSYLMQVCKPCHYALIEAVESFKLHPMSMSYIYMRCLSTFSGCGWAYVFTITPLTPQSFPQTCESWLKSYMMQVCKPCHYALIEAVEPFKLHPMSMSYTYEVFEHLLRLWMDIWLHTHINTITDVSPDLWELVEILSDASVQTMPLYFGWGCRTFQTASHVHAISIWGVWAPSQVVDRHMASHSHRYHHRWFPRFWEVNWNPTWCKCVNHATMLCLRL